MLFALNAAASRIKGCHYMENGISRKYVRKTNVIEIVCDKFTQNAIIFVLFSWKMVSNQ